MTSKSRWKIMTEEQRAHARRVEQQRRATHKQQMTEEQRAKLSQQRKEQRERRKERDLEHHQSVAREYKREGKGWFFSWANAIRTRAQSLGLPYDLDADYLESIMTTHCPVLGVELVRRSDRRSNSPSAPTVDRLIPELGYVRGNVTIISRRANNIKSDASVEEIRAVAEWVESRLLHK